MRSTDGSNWLPSTDVGGLAGNARGIAYGKDNLGVGLWVACGNFKILTSRDGITWTAAATQSAIYVGYSVAYGKNASGVGLWVIVGDSTSSVSSTDGNNWYAVANNGDNNAILYKVAYGKNASGVGLWVAIGGTTIVSSTDGNYWTKASSIGGLTNVSWGIAYKS